LWREIYHQAILDFCNNIGTKLPVEPKQLRVVSGVKPDCRLTDSRVLPGGKKPRGGQPREMAPAAQMEKLGLRVNT
jgi:hypothetical protein